MSRRVVPRMACLVVAAIVAVAVPLLHAGTTGKIAGLIVNEKKEPLAGVSVEVVGLRMGGVSDEQGHYFIIGVPSGTFTVRASLMGHAPYVLENVRVVPDFTTDVNVTLRTEAVQMGEVRVEAERPLLQRDATGTTRFLSAGDIQKLPTRGYRDAAAQQTGVVSFQRNIDNENQNSPTLIIRGGRPNETAYFVDGFSQQDPLTGTSSTAINNNAIEEVVVLTGGFAPEYGRIMSGAVNVVTREGSKVYSGAVEAVTDALAGDWVGSRRTDYNIYDASLGGPVIPGRDALTFYVSGERRWQRDRAPNFFPDIYKREASLLGLNQDYKPNNSQDGYSLQAKLNWRLNDALSLKFGGLGSDDDWREYTHAYLFDAEHMPRYLDRNRSAFGTFNHTLSPKLFYNLGVNWFQTERRRGDGVAFDDLTAYFRDPNPRFISENPMFWLPGHVWDDYLQRKSSYIGTQASLTWQFDPHNQIKAGMDFQRHTLRLFNHYYPASLGGDHPDTTSWDGYGYDLVWDYDASGALVNPRLVENDDEARDGPKHPKTYSLYVQDKYEREGLVVNGGLRLDYIDVDTPALIDESYPLGDTLSDPGNKPDVLESRDLQDNKAHMRISPRFGVAFPVDERTVMRFNFGQFYQQPNLQDLYVSYRFLEYMVQQGPFIVGFGNPNLKPERTTAYEVGFARQLGDNTRLDVTAYYKDVKDLVEITGVPSHPKVFASFRNRDYATIKGVDIGFTMRPVNHLSANVSYSLSYAAGTGSVSQTQFNPVWQGTATPKQTAPLDFDQRHKMSLNLDWSLDKGEGPVWNGMRLLERTGVNVLAGVGSGTPYTPTLPYDEVTLAAVSTSPVGPINSRYGPWTSNIDFKVKRGFTFSSLDFEAFVWVLNVLDTENPFRVYAGTGSAQTTGFLDTSDGKAFLETAAAAGRDGRALYRLAENDPTMYGNPRLVRFGLRTSF